MRLGRYREGHLKLSHLRTPKLSRGPPSFCCFVRMSHQVPGNPHILLVFPIYLFCLRLFGHQRKHLCAGILGRRKVLIRKYYNGIRRT